MNIIIESILDTDLYKLTQQQCVFHQYPNSTAEYSFKLRNKGVKLGFLAKDIRHQISLMDRIHLTFDESDYLSKLSFMKNDYISYLLRYKFKPSQVVVEDVDEELKITIAGPWVETILWEVPILSIVNELYFASLNSEYTQLKHEEIYYHGQQQLDNKIEMVSKIPRFVFVDFGTRRRYSKDWHRHVVNKLKSCCPSFIGTSNVKLAMDFGVKSMGTMAHEYISAHLSLVDNIRQAQKRALYVWLQEYGTSLGIALSDTFTSKAFFNDFDFTLANNFSGVRQDSGDPIEFGKKAIEHYKSLGIDPRTKSVVFSDGLDFKKAIQIHNTFIGLVGVSFGIGTNLTNDVGYDPLNIVIKLVSCNGKPVVKLSDNMTKAIGQEEMIKRVMESYGV